MIRTEAPFDTIESAQEFLALLGVAIDEARAHVRQEIEACADGRQQRRVDAWQVVLYTTTKLETHVTASRRLLNDLRTLRNLLHRDPAGATGRRAATRQDART